MILWLFFSENTCIQSLVLPIMTRLASDYNTRHCSGYFCPHHVWPTSVMLRIEIGRDLIDWLLGLLFVPIDSFISSYLCSIILSTEVHHKLCQQMQYSTPPTVIRLLHWESPDLIRKGTWPLTTTPSPLLPSFCLLSSRLLLSPLVSSCLLLSLFVPFRLLSPCLVSSPPLDSTVTLD